MNQFQRPPQPPQGWGESAIYFRQLIKYVENNLIRSVKGARLIPDPRGGFHIVIPKSKNQQFGAVGWQWQQPYKELDPTLFVPKDTFVYITPGNVLVTTGMHDAVTHANVISCEGIWQAAQDVPPKTSTPEYNVPVFPYPNATGIVTGSPGSLQGDLDGDGTPLFWIYWGQVAC